MDNAMPTNWIHAAEPVSESDWTVAITGIDTAAGAAVARCLQVATGFCGRILGLGRSAPVPSDCADGSWDSRFSVPDPVAGASVLLAQIDRIRQEESIDAIIPCQDADLPNYITLQPELARRGIRLMLPDRATLYSRNKDYLPTLCAKAEVSTPRVRRITHEGFFDLKGIDGQFWRYPMVVKGIFYDAYVVHTPDEAKQRFQQVAKDWGYPVLVQEFIEGEEVAFATLGDGIGNATGVAMVRKQGCSCIAIEDQELCTAGQRLMRTLKWRGPLEMEMLRDKAGKLHLIEINPRFPAWIDVAADAGSNLPASMLALMQEEQHGFGELVPPSWWNGEPAIPSCCAKGWLDDAWRLAGFGHPQDRLAQVNSRLARFSNRGDDGMPIWSSDYFACLTT